MTDPAPPAALGAEAARAPDDGPDDLHRAITGRLLFF